MNDAVFTQLQKEMDGSVNALRKELTKLRTGRASTSLLDHVSVEYYGATTLESITLDREVMHLRDSLSVKFSESVYYGFWFAPEFELLRKMIAETQVNVTGDVRLKLYRGNAMVVGRKSAQSLYDEKIATFEADTVYNQRDAEGFIKLNALRLRLGRGVAQGVKQSVAQKKS